MKILPSFILIAAAANVGGALAPRGKTRRTVLFALSLATLLALLLPILSALGELPAIPEALFAEESGIPDADPTSAVLSAAQTALSGEIARRFGIVPVSVSVRLPEQEGAPGAVRVVLASRDAGLKSKIAAWLGTESRADVAVLCEEECE